jgi:2'-5' RNA ligase
MRLFISIDLPAAVRRKLHGWLSPVPGLRYVNEPQLHLTLLFLGECDDDQAGLITARLKSVDFDPFRLIVRDIGAFPDRKSPRVIWAGVEKSKELNDLQRQVSHYFSEFADKKGNQSFKPHITLARTKKGFSVEDSDSLFKMTQPITVMVHSVSLKKSVLSDKGSTHTVLEKVYARG